MGFFSFRNNFEILVEHPQAEVYKKFVAQIRKRGWTIAEAKQPTKLVFQSKVSLFSWPIDFGVCFEATDTNETILVVESVSGNLDLGRSKGMINDIINDIYK